MDCLAAFHCGEVVTSVQRAALQAGGTEAVVYGGILGTVGALVPFTTRDDVDFFTHLEMCVAGSRARSPRTRTHISLQCHPRLPLSFQVRAPGGSQRRGPRSSHVPLLLRARQRRHRRRPVPPPSLPSPPYSSPLTRSPPSPPSPAPFSCECFNILDPAKQKQIADELERTPGEVAKKLEDMRNRLM